MLAIDMFVGKDDMIALQILERPFLFSWKAEIMQLRISNIAIRLSKGLVKYLKEMRGWKGVLVWIYKKTFCVGHL